MKENQIRELVNELRDIAIEYHGTQQLRERIARTVRAAIIQAGNSQVTPDRWIPVSERMPPQGLPLLVCSSGGVVQRTIYGFDGENFLDWYEQYDPVKAESGYSWMPLPAAPQQEVKS
ncbi:DUF551 domain-containing protein [Salmonella enterica subsp. enterica serovar Bovismorbificans]|uniref:DUF551 domain-containing protein n=1 Tax=Salmonella enterica TaxID=28901 RepID=UPI00026956F3|nr:DUF551 domain-containing protein [Salmonella enterica]EBX6374700.1 DUF551 domain-containing protein [Salmonella enterica subsp. enterica serovar Newport]EDV3650306.1 DUF551 domain-containing protein [Salmonella enterica subsp. enterica serovar Bovismorbificans]EGP1939332.1 DUF551 domain-containing protein [Salmonella enterica]EGP2991987.1 DUF551 domain-containing protein [Salmonella enterica]EJA85682.1 hypothetical protein SEEN470_12901 [Salmonella enterica subsp. enterica serovar Newport s